MREIVIFLLRYFERFGWKVFFHIAQERDASCGFKYKIAIGLRHWTLTSLFAVLTPNAKICVHFAK